MLLWVGLGNPGAKYAGNRHNIGFMVIDHIHDTSGTITPFSSKFKGLVNKDIFVGTTEDVVLLKPMTFMNLSGQSVRAAMNFYKIPIEKVTVFHDELDIALGKVKIKRGGGTAGHNGLRSIKEHCGNEFQRVRIGIGHPGHKDRVHSHVLSDFYKNEVDLRDDVIQAIGRKYDYLVEGQSDLFQTRVMENIALHNKHSKGK